ncbi:hypothetical protein [Nonomuraea sp. KM90]|uniref:hypothetical protein n=1 Tax=Nonomuraea sp. KM90 TaxID=3457428 RepID=UPI003FCD3165
MTLRTRRMGTALAAMAVTLAATAVTAGQASAAPEDCASWPSPSRATEKELAETAVPKDGTYVGLWFGKLNGRGIGWAKISGFSGDKYWLDVSHTGGRDWFQCGPFTLTGTGPRGGQTPAHYTDPSPSVVFRACGRAYGASTSLCTGWY